MRLWKTIMDNPLIITPLLFITGLVLRNYAPPVLFTSYAVISLVVLLVLIVVVERRFSNSTRPEPREKSEVKGQRCKKYQPMVGASLYERLTLSTK